MQACLKLVKICLLNLPSIFGKFSQSSNHFTIRNKEENAHHYVSNDGTNCDSNGYPCKVY